MGILRLALAVSLLAIVGQNRATADRPTVSSAEPCGGWVVWRDYSPGPSQVGKIVAGWYILAGAPDFKSCSTSMQRYIDDAMSAGGSSAKISREKLRSDLVGTYDKGTGDMLGADHYVCLPASVDPRGK